MKNLLVLLAHLLATVAKVPGPGGTKAVVADSLLMKQQLLVISRSRRRAPNRSISLPLSESCLASGRCFSPHAVSSEPVYHPAIDAAQISRRADVAQVQAAVLTGEKGQTRPEGAVPGTHPDDCGPNVG